ncbi:Exonuclease 1 [Phytophthora citrophthora]|uniref:Exonuclease 1 n=1 Tax=Phytophthora citrophthora TaxID=4793 RepID=A0AAD9GKX0_9STRA|nr:Exonuclease 1 [Phytophthora citrophthora]
MQLHIKLLQDNNITPIMVFDGAPLPSKAQENIARGRSRTDWRRKAIEMLQEPEEDQDGREIFKACTRGVSVTNEMVMRLIATLRRMDVTFYVAPYEADAQLAFFSKQKIVDVVISEDSDCVPYGVKTALLKLQPDGWGTELKRRSLGANEELSFVGWTEEMFIQLCVLAGCDYCRSVPGVGIMTAYKLVNQYKTPTKILKALQQQKGSTVPEDYAERFYSAILTYRHQLVFDPRDAKLKLLTPLDASKHILPLVDKGLHFLGNVELRDDVVASIASGQIHPVTHESYVWKDTAAAVLQEEEEQPASNSARTRSSTSSENSGLAQPHRRKRNNPARPDKSSQEEFPSARAAIARIRYEKPRPSSRSNWTHLDSVLGFSDHIVNFRSPKVSENFKPLSPLPAPTVKASIKDLESRPAHDHVKRVRNPANRRRDGKGSGFEGEVLCRIDQGQTPKLRGSTEAETVDYDADRLTDEENAPSQPVKRLRLSEHSSSLSSRMSESSSQKLVRPTPFGCSQRPSSTQSSVSLNRKLPPRHFQQRSIHSEPVSNRTFAMSAEEKWDRILSDEIDDTNSQVSSQKEANSTPASVNSASSSRQPLVPIK